MQDTCVPPAQADSSPQISGARLVGHSAVCFLLPLAAGVVAAAVVRDESMRVLAAAGAFLAAAATASVALRLLSGRGKAAKRP